jgi:hypothetical protein
VQWARRNRSSAVFCSGLKVTQRVERSAMASSGVNVLTSWTAFLLLSSTAMRRGKLFRCAVLVDQVQRLIPCDVTHGSRSAQEQRATDGYHLSDPVH